ncbi:MAG: GumC family protein [Elainellaceae cyanobacterium]
MKTEQSLSVSGMPSANDEGGLELGQVAAALRRRALIIAGVTTVVASAAVLKALTDTPVYQSNFEILTEPVTLETRIISTANPETLSNQEDFVAVSIDEAKLKVLKSPKVLAPVLETLQPQHPNLTYQNLFDNLSVSTTSEDILTVIYQSPDPDLVQDVLETVAEAYVEFSLEDRQSDILRGIKFVDEQLPQLRERVDSLQEELEILRRQYNLIDPEVQSDELARQISAFKQEQLSIQVQLDEARRLYADLQQELDRQGETAVASALTEDPRYQSLLDQILELDRQISQDSVLLREESPEIQILQERRQSLLPLVEQQGVRVERQVSSYIRELDARNQALADAINSLNTQIKELSSVTRQYSDIQRELQIATNNLNEFLSKREALRIDAAQRQAPWELLSQPEKPRASVASARRNLLLGTALGLILGTGIALFIDKLSSVIHTSKEIKDITRLPILGIIPLNRYLEADNISTNAEAWLRQSAFDVELANSEVSNSYSSVPFTEAFRSLYTNIRLINPDVPIRSLTVSSSTPNEGKSTVTVHLAQAAAAMGQRVLIVDADLRRPSVHKLLGMENSQGLMDLVAMNLPLEDVIQQSVFYKNLFVLSAGHPPPDPPTILASNAMQTLSERIQGAFDLVIYDTPPLIGFADSFLTASQSQGLLMVVGLEKIKRAQLEQGVEEIKVAGIPVLGIVANRSEEQAITSYSYYQYYTHQAPEHSLAHQTSLQKFKGDATNFMKDLLSKKD